MGDILSKIDDLLDDTQYKIESIASSLIGDGFSMNDYNRILVEQVYLGQPVNIVIKTEELGRCYHKYYALGFNTIDDNELNSGNFNNRAIVKKTQEFTYYTYNIDSGD